MSQISLISVEGLQGNTTCKVSLDGEPLQIAEGVIAIPHQGIFNIDFPYQDYGVCFHLSTIYSQSQYIPLCSPGAFIQEIPQDPQIPRILIWCSEDLIPSLHPQNHFEQLKVTQQKLKATQAALQEKISGLQNELKVESKQESEGIVKVWEKLAEDLQNQRQFVVDVNNGAFDSLVKEFSEYIKREKKEKASMREQQAALVNTNIGLSAKLRELIIFNQNNKLKQDTFKFFQQEKENSVEEISQISLNKLREKIKREFGQQDNEQKTKVQEVQQHELNKIKQEYEIKLKTLLDEYHQKKAEQIQKITQQLTKQSTELRQELKKAQENYEDIKRSWQSLTVSHQESLNELLKLQDLAHSKEILEIQLNVCKGNNKHLQTRLQELTEELGTKNQKIKLYQDRQRELINKLQQNRDLDIKISQISEDFNSSFFSNPKMYESEQNHQQIESQVVELQEELNEYKSALQALQDQFDALAQENLNANRTLCQLFSILNDNSPQYVEKFLDAYLACRDIPNYFQHLSQSLFTVKGKKVNLVVRNGNLLVKLGGGYKKIDEFLLNY